MNLNIPVHENVPRPSTIVVLSFNGAFPKSTGFTLGIHLGKSQLKCLCKSAFLLLFIFSCGFQEELALPTNVASKRTLIGRMKKRLVKNVLDWSFARSICEISDRNIPAVQSYSGHCQE